MVETLAATQVTNQNIIDAFARAASTLGLASAWDFLARAGLDLTAMAGDRGGAYSGPAMESLPNLTANERSVLAAALKDVLAATPVSEPVTASLHTRADVMGAALAPSAERTIATVPANATAAAQMMIRIWNRYGGLLDKVAGLLGADPALAAGVLAIESGGRAFSSSGRMIIRFELHVFHSLWGSQHQAKFDTHFRFDSATPWRGDSHEWRPDTSQEWRAVHASQDSEWDALAFARVECNDEAAKQSISMGAPQIMGFNHARIGYDDVDAMFDAFENDERSQVVAFFDFVRTDSRLLDATRKEDLLTFATYYNGSAVAPTYASLMRDAVTSLRQSLPGATQPTTPVTPTAPVTPVTPGEPVGPNGVVSPGPMVGPLVGPNGESPRPGVFAPVPSLVVPATQPDQLPLPPAESGLLKEVDPTLYGYWRDHVRDGFEQNNEMFNRVLNAFMEPYYTTVWMYRVLFAVGITGFILAVGLTVWSGNLWYAAVFGGLSTAAFISFFISRPLQALEENLHFITWLGIIYNTYWTRIAYMFDQTTVQQDLNAATEDAVAELDKLLEKHAQMTGRRPGAKDS